MDNDTLYTILGFVIGAGLMAIVCILIGAVDVSELGDAICSENGKGDFVSYSGDVVTCEDLQPAGTDIEYDGLLIKTERGG